jgi:hypothetical protein
MHRTLLAPGFGAGNIYAEGSTGRDAREDTLRDVRIFSRAMNSLIRLALVRNACPRGWSARAAVSYSIRVE